MESVLRTGEPPARVPHAKTVRRTVLDPLLRRNLCGIARNFADCGRRPKAPPLESASLPKGLTETFNLTKIRDEPKIYGFSIYATIEDFENEDKGI